MKRLEYRTRPYIGQKDPQPWRTHDECRVIRKEWRDMMRRAEPHQGETEYRIVDVPKVSS
jgi:hypothetical protein